MNPLAEENENLKELGRRLVKQEGLPKFEPVQLTTAMLLREGKYGWKTLGGNLCSGWTHEASRGAQASNDDGGSSRQDAAVMDTLLEPARGPPIVMLQELMQYV